MASSGHYGEPISDADLLYLDDAIQNATKLGMSAEFWGTFLQGIRQGGSIQASITGANYEWDL